MALCPAPIYGVTGSDGKTTTSTILSRLLEAEGYTTWLGGNIGTPLLEHVKEISASDQVVVELSSFQLSSMRQSPDVAVITNISPTHLDVHRDYQEYIGAKKNIMLFQSFMGRLVLNGSNYETQTLTSEARGEIAWFNDRHGSFGTLYVDREGTLIEQHADGREVELIKTDELKLPGKHNIENYLAAIAAVRPKVSRDAISRVATTFRGVEHRLEFVRELDGVSYYNSSIDSSPTRTKAVLRAFAVKNKPMVLITGGKDKNSDYSGLGEAITAATDRIILCGSNAEQIHESIRREARRLGVNWEHLTIVSCDSYGDAVAEARRLARPGDSVVLSPAGTSFDRFQNFEERGDCFKELVRALL